MNKISQGAEAIIYKKGQNIIKKRPKKNYRIKELDNSMRKFRTKREIKVLKKLQEINFPSPKIIKSDDFEIQMSFIQGKKIRDVLNKNNFKEICQEIGENLSILHQNNIIHFDLTTSNMILNNKDNNVYFIDFGLSFFTPKIEHQAVDLHLLKHALESYHYKIFKEAFDYVIKGYSKNPKFEKVMQRLKKVESRGRNKGKK